MDAVVAARSRQQIAKLPREEVEDRLYSLTEENIELKKHGHQQDEKLKRLATKILRLKSDMKKLGVGKPVKYSNENDVVEDLQHKVVTLEQQVNSLQSKLKAAKHNHVESAKKPNNIYSFVESRVDTGQPGQFQTPPKRTPGKKGGNFPQYGNSMLQGARQEIEQLDNVVEQLRSQIEVLEDDKQALVNQQQDQELSYENTILALREQLLEIQRTGIAEDIDVINLQRQIKDKEDDSATATNKLLKAKNELAQCKTERDHAESELEELKQEMKRMDKKFSTAKSKANESVLYTHEAQELTLALEEVRGERDILREENSRLMGDVFSGEKEKTFKHNERKLRERVKQLEHRLDRHQNQPTTDTHDEMFDKYMSEKEKALKLENELSKLEQNTRIMEGELNSSRAQIKEADIGRLKDKEVYQTQLIKASISSPAAQMAQYDTDPAPPVLTLQRTEESPDQLAKELSELQSEHATVVLELDRTVKLLEIQHKLNKEYQEEVTAVTSRYEKVRREGAQREDETAKLLDIRGARINKLELQLRDIAYGTKAVRLEAPSHLEESLADQYDVKIERGQNIVEVHFGKLYLSDSETSNQGMFLIFGFHHFEIVTSPVKTVKSLQPEFNFTSHYVVNVDEFFLRCLQKVASTVYLYACTGMDFRCVGVCQLHFKELLDNGAGNRLHGSLQILGTEGTNKGMSYGNLDYSIRLKLPMVHALQLFKEKVKANSYLTSNTAQLSQAEPTQDNVSHADPQFNELKVTVLRCQELGQAQPSSYAVYKFYTFPDHDTSIIMSSNTPQYNDVKVYPVTVDTQLHRYLTQAVCKIYILNDSETDYLIGTADVPLLPLAHGKAIEGTFQLADGKGHPAGYIEVCMSWGMTYCTPTVTTNRIPSEKLARLPEQLPAGSVYSAPVVESVTPSSNPITQSVPVTINPSLAEYFAPVQAQYKKSLQEEQEEEDELLQAEIEKEQELLQAEIRREQEILATEERARSAREEQQRTEFLSFRSQEEYAQAVEAQSQGSDQDTASSPGSVPDTSSEPLEVSLDPPTPGFPAIGGFPPLSGIQPGGGFPPLAGIQGGGGDFADSISDGSDSDLDSLPLHQKLLASQPETHISPLVKSPLPSTKSISSTNIEEEIDEEIEELGEVESMLGTMEGTGDITAVSELKMMPTNTTTNFDDSSSEDDGVVLGTSTLHELKMSRTPPTPSVAPAPTTPGATLDTTFFEEDPSSDEEDDVVIPVLRPDIDEDLEELESTDEDELVVVTPSPSASLNTPRAPPIVVVVHHIEFDQAALFIDKPDVKQVFVEYKLLGVDPADTETPQSLKVKGGVKLSYNFRKTFFIDKGSEEWVLLNEMVSAKGDRKVTFTVVSDPGEATDKECINLCTATVELPTGSDLFDHTLDLISPHDGSKVGVICVTMETFKALLALGILPNNL